MPESRRNADVVRVPMLPLRDILVFPATAVPLFVGRERSIRALEEAMVGNKEILLAAQTRARINEPDVEDIHEVGTISTILQFLKLPDGTVKVLVEGQRRARIIRYLQLDDYFLVEAEELQELPVKNLECEALV